MMSDDIVPRAGPSQDPLFAANHFTLLRWILATGVVIGHAWLIPTGYEPTRLHDWTLSYLSVNGFFILSGLLIAKSLFTRQDIGSYARSRLLRIYPALILLMAALLFVFGPLFGSPGNAGYFKQFEPWAYVTRVLLMGDPLTAPGDVFHAEPDAVFNGALWTIRYEVLAYVLAGIGFWLGVLRHRWVVVGTLAGVQLMYLVAQSSAVAALFSPGMISLFRFMTCFLLGMTIWHFPVLRRLGLAALVSTLAAFLLLGWSPFGEMLANLLLAASLMYFGLVASPIPRIARMPDYSYGIYIWHYPVLQSILIMIPGISPMALLATSLPLILGCAAASWHALEKPALKLKRWRRISGRLSG